MIYYLVFFGDGRNHTPLCAHETRWWRSWICALLPHAVLKRWTGWQKKTPHIIIYYSLCIICYWLFIIYYVWNTMWIIFWTSALQHRAVNSDWQSGSGAAKVTSASSRAQNRAFPSVSAPGALQAKMRSATWRSGSWMPAFYAVCGRGAPDAEGYILLYEQTLRAPRKLRSSQGKPWLRERHERHRAPRTAPRRTACGTGVGAWAPCGAAVRFYEGEEITSAPQRYEG